MFEAKKMKKHMLAAAFGACLLHGGATAHAEDVYAVTSPSGDQRYYVVTETITEKEDGFSVVVKRCKIRFVDAPLAVRLAGDEFSF